MGLAPFMEVRAAQLSGGLHKTAVLAATFLTNPDGLFLDEPASALDDHRTARLYEGLARLGETLTFLVITGQESAGINFVRRHLTMDNGHLK